MLQEIDKINSSSGIFWLKNPDLVISKLCAADQSLRDLLRRLLKFRILLPFKIDN
jgi:hypothetical protein